MSLKATLHKSTGLICHLSGGGRWRKAKRIGVPAKMSAPCNVYLFIYIFLLLLLQMGIHPTVGHSTRDAPDICNHREVAGSDGHDGRVIIDMLCQSR